MPLVQDGLLFEAKWRGYWQVVEPRQDIIGEIDVHA